MARIKQNEDYLSQLRSLIEPAEVLQKNGYILQPLSTDDLMLKRRCIQCKKAMSQLVSKRNQSQKVAGPNRAKRTETMTGPLTSRGPLPFGGPLPGELTKPPATQAPKFRCQYHPGDVLEKHWSCCGQHVSAEPCSGSNLHIPLMQPLNELTKLYQFHPTPTTPPKKSSIRNAVAFDCEMGTAANGDTEVIRVSLIDYFTQEILVNNLVEPDVPMKHLNTKYSGVSWADMRRAKREGTCLKGLTAARRAVWTFVGQNTILVGHGASNDLRCMKWLHPLVVDSFVTEFTRKQKIDAELKAKQEAETPSVKEGKKKTEGVTADMREGDALKPKQPRGPGNFSLKTLAKRHLNRNIQQNGKGHDSLEDAIASRDLIHWRILNPNVDIPFDDKS